MPSLHLFYINAIQEFLASRQFTLLQNEIVFSQLSSNNSIADQHPVKSNFFANSYTVCILIVYISNVFKNGPDLDLNRHLKKKQTGNVLGKKPRYLLPFCMFKKFFVSTFYTKAVLDTRNLASFYSI